MKSVLRTDEDGMHGEHETKDMRAISGQMRRHLQEEDI